jgi:glycogen synthase
MPEVAGNGACFINPYDVQSITSGFQRVIQDKNYRENLVLHGFENIKRFSPDKIANQYMCLYQEVAKG